MSTPGTHHQKFVDFERLEQEFKDAIGGLSNYKRTATYAYINALKNEIIRLNGELELMSEEIISNELEA